MSASAAVRGGAETWEVDGLISLLHRDNPAVCLYRLRRLVSRNLTTKCVSSVERSLPKSSGYAYFMTREPQQLSLPQLRNVLQSSTSAGECLAVVYLSWGMSCSRLPQLGNVLQSSTSAAECLAVVYLSCGMSCSRLPQLRNVLQSSQETEHVAYHLLYALSRSFIAAINLSTITRKSFTLKRKPLPWSVLRDQSRFQDWFHRHTPDFACGYGVLQLCNCCVQPVQCLFSHTRRIVLSFRPERFQKSTDFKRSTAVFSATPGSWKDKLTLLTSQFSFRTRHRAVDPLISTWSCLRNQRNWLQQNSSQLRICRPGLQATAHKNFHFHQLRAPKTAGPDAAAPLAPSPPLMRHW